MIANILFFIHYALLLVFGVTLSAAFAGVRPIRKNVLIFGGICIFSGLLQILLFGFFGEETVWKLYPFVCHLPILLMLLFGYRRRLSTALAAIASAYLCCQPANWFGVVLQGFSVSPAAERLLRIVILITVGSVAVFHLAGYLSRLYRKDDKSVWIFGIIPILFYIFDYVMGVYSDTFVAHSQVAAQFLAFFLCVSYMLFCVVYYREHEQMADAQRKEHLIQITLEQQAKELEAVRRSEHEIRLLRHDMRLMLNSLSLYISQGELENAQKLIAHYAAQVESTSIHRYCENDMLNYLLSEYAAKCQKQDIVFTPVLELTDQLPDEIKLSTILSNALDNAINAQKELPAEGRKIRLMLKTSGGKLLLSVKNPIASPPIFVDGLPISRRPGHGYGTQSIRWLTEQLGGNCQFTVEEDRFILRVVI